MPRQSGAPAVPARLPTNCSRAYPARIRYLEGEVARTLSKHSHTICTTDCRVCRAASFAHAARLSQRHLAAASASMAQSSSSSSSLQGSNSARQGRASIGGLPAAGSSGSLGSSAGGLSRLQSPAIQRSTATAASAPSRDAAAAEPAAAAAEGSMCLGPASSCAEAPPFLRPAAEAGDRHAGEEWQEVRGEFCSIMLIGGVVGRGGREGM